MYAMQPITYTTGSEIQAPYRTVLQPGNVESGVALGPASRLAGECLARHVSQPGMCWGKFSSQNTRAVDQYDPMVSGALQTQWALGSNPYNTLHATGNVSNILSYSGQQQIPTNIENKTQIKLKMDKAQKKAQADMKKAEKAAKKAQKAAEKEAKKAEKAGKSQKAAAACKRAPDGSCLTCE